MSVDIIAIREPGDRQGPDVENRLICTVTVALDYARNFFDENSGLQSISIVCVLRASVRTGQVVEVQDSLQGVTWRGKIEAVEHTVGRTVAETSLKILRQL